MSGELKVIGRAVAREKAYYPTSSGVCDIVRPGDTFDVLEGHSIKGWADPLPADKAKRKAEGSPPEGDEQIA